MLDFSLFIPVNDTYDSPLIRTLCGIVIRFGGILFYLFVYVHLYSIDNKLPILSSSSTPYISSSSSIRKSIMLDTTGTRSNVYDPTGSQNKATAGGSSSSSSSTEHISTATTASTGGTIDDNGALISPTSIISSGRRKTTYSGLANQGATCYMNSLLQVSVVSVGCWGIIILNLHSTLRPTRMIMVQKICLSFFFLPSSEFLLFL